MLLESPQGLQIAKLRRAIASNNQMLLLCEPSVFSKHYNWILGRYKNDPETVYMLGQVCFDLEEYEKSMYYFSIYLKKYPNHVNALKYSGHIALTLEKYEEAKKYYLSVLEKNPNSPKVLNNIGIIFYKQGNLKKADHFFKLSLKYDPDYRDAYQNLKNIQSQIKK